MRLTNVDRANSSVLAKAQAYEIPIYMYGPARMLLGGRMETFIALLGRGAKLKAHADMFLNIIEIMSL